MTIVDPKTERPDEADLDKAADRPEDADQWTRQDPQRRSRRTAAPEAPPRPPARLRGVLDLRVRGRSPSPR